MVEIRFRMKEVMLDPAGPLQRYVEASKNNNNTPLTVHNQAVRLFVQNEFGVCSVLYDFPLPRQPGLKQKPELILIGKWRYSPDKNLFLRADENSGLLAVRLRDGSDAGEWIYQFMPEVVCTGGYRPKGKFLDVRGTTPDCMRQAISALERIDCALTGYVGVVRSRKS